MNRLCTVAMAAVSLLIGVSAQAQSINLQNLTSSDFEKIVDGLSANFNHTSVSGASPLGHVFGFEVGIVGGKTNTPGVNEVVHKGDPNADASSMPFGQLLGMVTVPAGVTVELGLVPRIGKEDFKFNSLSLAAKWTFSELIELPLSLAVKGHFTTASMEAKQTVSNVPTTYSYKNNIKGLTLLASKDFAIVEPYVGLGLLSAKGDLDVSGTAAFDPSFTSSTSVSATRTSSEILVGAELKLMVVKLGLEYAKAFDNNRFAGKLSFYF